MVTRRNNTCLCRHYSTPNTVVAFIFHCLLASVSMCRVTEEQQKLICILEDAKKKANCLLDCSRSLERSVNDCPCALLPSFNLRLPIVTNYPLDKGLYITFSFFYLLLLFLYVTSPLTPHTSCVTAGVVVFVAHSLVLAHHEAPRVIHSPPSLPPLDSLSYFITCHSLSLSLCTRLPFHLTTSCSTC